MTSCFVYNIISVLKSIKHLCNNPIRRISNRISSSGVHKLMFNLKIINKNYSSSSSSMMSLSLSADRTVAVGRILPLIYNISHDMTTPTKEV